MAKRRKYPRLPNGYGSIKKLSGKNRTTPYGVYPPTKEFDSKGNPVAQKALCYVDDWYKGFTVLTWYNHGEYYEGREKELSSDATELKKQITETLAKFNQSQREASDQKTFKDIYEEYYLWKFKKAHDHNEKKTTMEYSLRSAFRNCKALHEEVFRKLTTNDLQKVIDNCPLKHSSLELITVLFHQMYAYAEANDLVDKDYSKYVKIGIQDDDESGVPFTESDLKLLWKNKDNPVVEFILIMCYSRFRITAYKSLQVNLEERYFLGGIKTKAGRDRYVPIHSGIYDLVEKRLQRDGCILLDKTGDFRKNMYKTLKDLGIERHTPHDCRHTFSMLCDKYKVNENDKKRLLGHAFKDITNKVYGHRELKDLRTEIEKIICH